MYENYLICPEAIVAVMKDLATFKENALSVETIRQWLSTSGGGRKYITGNFSSINLYDPEWLRNVDAAKLLKDLFEELSVGKEEYRKTVHSVQLTDWLLKNKPDALAGILDFLKQIVEPLN